MATGDSKGGRAHHLIDTKFGARELRRPGEKELGYLKEELAGDTVTNNAELFEQMRTDWSFSGESPRFVYIDYRMNEVTTAVGLAQLEFSAASAPTLS